MCLAGLLNQTLQRLARICVYAQKGTVVISGHNGEVQGEEASEIKVNNESPIGNVESLGINLVHAQVSQNTVEGNEITVQDPLNVCVWSSTAHYSGAI